MENQSPPLCFSIAANALCSGTLKRKTQNTNASFAYSCLYFFHLLPILAGFSVNPDEILTYEEVFFYHPRPNFKVGSLQMSANAINDDQLISTETDCIDRTCQYWPA